jgi:WASH complex subunit strumpellin
MADFLAEDNLCGRTLLNLVSRANAIIAELFRLSDRVPADFLDIPSTSPRRFELLLPDFGYLKQSTAFDANIESNQVHKILYIF